MELGLVDLVLLVGFLLTLVFAYKVFLAPEGPPSIRSSSKLSEASSVGGIDPAVGDEPEESKQDPGERLVILFGSQTGTAEEFAEGMAKEASGQGYAAEVLSAGPARASCAVLRAVCGHACEGG